MNSKQHKQQLAQELKDFKTSKVFQIFPVFKTGVLHRTGLHGFQSIQESGFLKPNFNGQFPFSYPQSQFFYGQKNGYICLFDFESAAAEDYCAVLGTWQKFFFDHLPVVVVFKLHREKLSAKLIPTATGRGITSYDYIPYIECWYPEPIPVSFVDSYILIKTKRGQKKYSFKEFRAEKIDELNKELHPYIEMQDALEKFFGEKFVLID